MTERPRIILASGSPRREMLMHQMGYEIEVRPSDVDENIGCCPPPELVRELSKRKCLDIADKMIKEARVSAAAERAVTEAGLVNAEETTALNEAFLVVGADTVVAVDGGILGKPKDAAEAEKMLRMISGRTHDVFTGVTAVLVKNGEICKEETFVQGTKVTVAELTQEDILEYIASGEPFGKAGAYGIQGIFGKYVEGIEGDYYNVVGLPICELYKTIRGML